MKGEVVVDLSANNPTSKLHSTRCGEKSGGPKTGKILSIVHHNLESSRSQNISRLEKEQEILWDIKYRRTVVRSSRLAGAIGKISPPGHCRNISESKKEAL